MFRPEAVLRAGVAIFALIAAGLVALLVTAHLESVDPRTLPAVRPPEASAPTPAPSPLTDLGRGDLGSVVTIQVEVELSKRSCSAPDGSSTAKATSSRTPM